MVALDHDPLQPEQEQPPPQQPEWHLVFVLHGDPADQHPINTLEDLIADMERRVTLLLGLAEDGSSTT